MTSWFERIAGGLNPQARREPEDGVDIGHVVDAVASQTERCDRGVLESSLTLLVEIAREGHEGRRVGTLFTIGRADTVLAISRGLILDPLAGHSPTSRSMFDERLRGTVKQLAQLDGAFVLAEDGTVVSACRYLDVPAEGVEVPLGLGARHVAAASISKRLGIVAVSLSQSGVIGVFCDGRILVCVEPPV